MAEKVKKYLSGRFAFKTDVGRVRLTNEDQAAAMINSRGNILLLVCDGMGGQNKGELASSLAKRVVCDAFESKSRFLNKYDALHWVQKTIKTANSEIYNQACKNADYEGMGTTITLVLIIKDYMILGQVGDSRAYAYKEGKFRQFSEDQTYVAYLYRTGQIKKEEMASHPKRHVLMNALGFYPSLDLEEKLFPYNDERILLCSDGLYNNVSDANIESVLRGNDSVDQKVRELISMANNNGGSDNIAIVIWEADE